MGTGASTENKSRTNSEITLDMNKVKTASQSERVQQLMRSRLKKPFDLDSVLEKEQIVTAANIWLSIQNPSFSTSRYEISKKTNETFLSFFTRK